VSCPNRDASWELNNEFEDQLSDYRKDEGCQMRNCKHKGKPNEDGTIFEIILCDQCGGHGSHIACDQVSSFEALKGQNHNFHFQIKLKNTDQN
jgi:hypothetical protein